jgi:hypothetical protein
MTKKGSIFGIIGIAVAFAGAVYLSTAAKLKSLQVGFSTFSTNVKFSFPYLYIPVNIALTNPNKQSVTFQSLDVNVFINGTNSAKISYNTPKVLQPGVQTAINSVLIKSEIFSTINESLKLLDKTVIVKLIGTIRADNMSFPVNETLTMK